MKLFQVTVAILLLQLVASRHHGSRRRNSVDAEEQDTGNAGTDENGRKERTDLVRERPPLRHDRKKNVEIKTEVVTSDTESNVTETESRGDKDASKSRTRTRRLKAESRDRANQFVDFVLNSFGSTVVAKKLQPLSLLDPPTKKIEISRDLFSATLHNVSIAKGLETIARVGDAVVTQKESDGDLFRTLTFSFKIKHVEITSNLSVKMFEFGPDVQFSATTKYIIMKVKAGIQTSMNKKDDKDFKVKLLRLSIVDFSPLKFDVQGMWGPINHIVKLASKFIVDVLRKPINHSVEHKMKKSLTKLINKGLDTSTSKAIFGMALKLL